MMWRREEDEWLREVKRVSDGSHVNEKRVLTGNGLKAARREGKIWVENFGALNVFIVLDGMN